MKIRAVLGAIAALAAALIAWFLGTKSSSEKKASREDQAREVRTQTEKKIEQTPAHDLVDAAPNSADLRGDVASIQDDTRRRIQQQFQPKN